MDSQAPQSTIDLSTPNPIPVFQVQPRPIPELQLDTDPGEAFRRIFGWVALITAGLGGLFMGAFLAYHSFQRDGWMVQLVQSQFPAMVLVPLAGLGAFCVVLVLRLSSGPLEFKAIGFEFKGASGQVVLWVVCFLAEIAAIKTLWIAP
jgi:hypothetical protein